MIKYIIFDFDGTLVDSKDIAISVINQLAEKYHFKKLEPEDIEYLRSFSLVERCKILKVPVYKLPFWAVEFYNLYKHSIKNLILFEGIKELLNELHHRGFHLAVISSNSEHNIRDFFQKNQINYIQQVFCSHKIFGKDKVIKNFLKTNNLNSNEVIYVGDEQRDIVACKKNGVKVVWVEWGFDLIDTVKHEDPDFIVNKPREILDIVQSNV